MKISVLGTGQWGTALAQILCDAGNEVLIWGRNSNVVDEINSRHTNTTSLPGVVLPQNLKATDDISEALQQAQMLVLAVPAQSLRENLQKWKSLFKKDTPIVSSLKGIEVSTQLRMTEVIQQVLEIPEEKLAIITGPNLAREVVLRQPAGAVAASVSQELSELVAQAFNTSYFRVYTSNDVIGCELAGAAKNVIALAVGMSIGMGFGENTQSLVITRGLNEVTRLGMARGAMPLTFVGLAGVGDLLATCGSPLSRNRSFGEALGRTGSMQSARADVSSTVEGVSTAKAVVDLAHLVGVEAPIMEAVYEVVSNNITPEQAIRSLMQIQTGAEIDHE
ncbi:MAG: NAD(P)-dependent glycerol-3-phosphate dehydrogenase [Candidatus Nanopelagicaceae bacterium]|nr:NAD(P)-dependent glycerol-3-phosphate dehydrogenase [Candidatus Nanopelagicaceae bacterium]